MNNLRKLQEIYPELSQVKDNDTNAAELIIRRIADDARFCLPKTAHRPHVAVFVDSLPLRVEQAKEELRDELTTLETGQWYDIERIGDEMCDRLNEIANSNAPVYTQEIKECWFLHGQELEDAYTNAGIGDKPLEDDGMAAICIYIAAELFDYLQEWIEEERNKLD